MTWVFAALAAALVVIYMARPNFRRAVLSSALFFQDDPVVGSTNRIAWSTPRPTPLFFLQLSVVLLPLLAVPHCRGAAVIDRSARAGVHVFFDRSASMSTQQNGGTRFDAALAALRTAMTSQQSAIACFRLSAFDLELTTVDGHVRSVGELMELASRLEPRPLGTELSLVQRAVFEPPEPPNASPDGCATNATVVVSDMPAPPWMDGPASRGDLWIDVSQPAPNAGIVDLVDDRDRVSGKVQRVRVVVGTFGGMAPSSVKVSVTSPDGVVRTQRIETWDGPSGSVDVVPTLAGRYTFQVIPGGAYRYDDDAAIEVPPSSAIRVDWRAAHRDWISRLGWVDDRDHPDLRVLPSIEMLDARPAIVLGSGYAPRTRPMQPVATFQETSPLLNGLNLDVAERSGMNRAPSLPPGFSPVLTGPENAVWIAQRAAPIAAFVPGLPPQGEDSVSRFASTVFLNAARWVLERRPRPALFTLTSPQQPQPSGNRLALHPGEGHTGRTSRSVGTFDPRAPRQQEAERRLSLWPWLVGAAALVFLAERGLALLRGAV